MFVLRGFSVTMGVSRRAGIYLFIHYGWSTEVAGQDGLRPENK